jgi:hypothetical protein
MTLTKKISFLTSSLFGQISKTGEINRQPAEIGEVIALSKIQTLPTELKLQILEEAADVLVLKNLVIACPCFHPIYRANKYRLLLHALQKNLSGRTDVLALVLLKIQKLEGKERVRRVEARASFTKALVGYDRRGRVCFVDSQPSLSDLVEVCSLHCQVLERVEKFSGRTPNGHVFTYTLAWNDPFLEVLNYLYCIEILAGVIGEKDRGWAVASLPRSGWEKQVRYMFGGYDIGRMSQIAKVIWPSRFQAPPCRRRIRVLIGRYARSQEHGGMSIDQLFEFTP